MLEPSQIKLHEFLPCQIKLLRALSIGQASDHQHQPIIRSPVSCAGREQVNLQVLFTLRAADQLGTVFSVRYCSRYELQISWGLFSQLGSSPTDSIGWTLLHGPAEPRRE
jgi:hypothetical protein